MADHDSNKIPQTVPNLIGKRFGKWVVLSYTERRPNAHYWRCECDCGTVKDVSGYTLRVGTSTNCGCEQIKHGKHGRPEYYIWRTMKQRCHNPKYQGYEYYGARGIKVCERWRNSFGAFYQDMGPRPTQKHSIDRINNDGDYTPDNCRWATVRQQERNKSSNHYITFRGKTRTLQGWAEHIGINHKTLRNRINTLGWDIERALTEPVGYSVGKYPRDKG